MDVEQRKTREARKKEYDTDSEDDEFWKDNETDNNNYPNFDEFDKIVEEKLATFSNKVFVKLNWSSPRDAYWSLSKLSCERLSDIYILLKSSDFINHDLNSAFNECVDARDCEQAIASFKYNLVLREWAEINPIMEFRCFVNKNKLIGIRQKTSS
jgi:hypothetical protein